MVGRLPILIPKRSNDSCLIFPKLHRWKNNKELRSIHLLHHCNSFVLRRSLYYTTAAAQIYKTEAPKYYSDPNYYTVATPSYTTTEAAKYYSDPSYSTKAPEYYTTATLSYYVDPSYYTAAVPSYYSAPSYSAPSYTATYYAKAAPEYYTTTELCFLRKILRLS
jgi:hypothetical protein